MDYRRYTFFNVLGAAAWVLSMTLIGYGLGTSVPNLEKHIEKVAIGPEGGWTAYEAGRLEEKGFRPVTLGPRPLRVDAAVPFAVGQDELWLRSPRAPPHPRLRC